MEVLVYFQLNMKCLWSSERTAHNHRSFLLLSVSAINSNIQFFAVHTNNQKKRDREIFLSLLCKVVLLRSRSLQLVGKRKGRSYKTFQV